MKISSVFVAFLENVNFAIVVKSNFFVRFSGELKVPKGHFEINWPLLAHKILEINLEKKNCMLILEIIIGKSNNIE